MEGPNQILALIGSVRARWRRLVLFRAVLEASLLVAAGLAVALLLASRTGRWPLVLGLVAAATLALVGFAVARAIRLVGPSPSDARVARFIEESDPGLDDRLASAVDLLSTPRDRTPDLAAALLHDVGRRAEQTDPRQIVPSHRLRRAGLLAGAALLLVAAIGLLGRHVVRESRDALALALFPSRVTLEVLPGNTRIRAGEPLTIEARLVGNQAPVDATVLRAPEGTEDDAAADFWETIVMEGDGSRRYKTAFDSVSHAFRYKVVAGALTSPVFNVDVTRPPRVARIDIDYTYPRNLGLEPRTDEDGGDIYGPAGTSVRLRVQIDGESKGGRLAIDDGSAIALTPLERALAGSLTLARDGTYRVALVDAEGVEHPASSEYFIRIQDDRPPDVRVLRPARDREVSPLEEVAIEVEARDDFGLDRLELVYAVDGGQEQVVRLDVPPRATSVTAGHTLYLEDLEVSPGDFVTYFVRARDVGRTARSTEARSDIFFLEVRPFDRQFRMADSQASGGGGRNQSLDGLVAAQKEIIVATWKLDRRSRSANHDAPEKDVRAVARAEAEVKMRTETMSSTLRSGAMRDPRRVGAGERRAVAALPGEESLVAAVEALGRAVEALEGLETSNALPAEMQALRHLLEAQAQVQERQVARQRAGGAGSNRSNQDLSELFDRELQREQRTNYEERQSAQPPDLQNGEDLLERIRDLARRQDELLREQRELDRRSGQMAETDRQRALQRLTRELQQLRTRVEQLARELRQSGEPGSPQQGTSPAERMDSAAESLRTAASGLREHGGPATEQSARALEQLREAERELQAETPEGQQRALGNLQFEARALAEAQRRLDGADLEAQKAGQAGRASDGDDQMRRVAGEQERLAERLERLRGQLARQGAIGGQNGAGADLSAAAREAGGEIDRQRLVERMQRAAESLRAQAVSGSGTSSSAAGSSSQPQTGDEIASALDRLADRLAGASGSSDGESRRLSSQLARAQDLRRRMADTTRELERIDRQARADGSSNGQTGAASQAIEQQIQDARALLEELRREDSGSSGGLGVTFEGQGMVQSAPGTEAFKQDLSRWEELRQQMTHVLDRAEASVAARLRARQSQDRLASGLDDRSPAHYQPHVDSYFKALADRSSR